MSVIGPGPAHAAPPPGAPRCPPPRSTCSAASSSSTTGARAAAVSTGRVAKASDRGPREWRNREGIPRAHWGGRSPMRPRPGGGRISAPPPADWQRDRRAFEREPRRPRAVNSGPIRRIFGRPQPKLHHPPRCLEPRRQMTRRHRNPAANSHGCKGGRRPSRSGPAAPNVAPIARNPRGEIGPRRSNVPRRPRGAELRGQDPAVHLAASSRPPPRSTASSKPPGVGVAPEAGAASHPRGGSSKAAMGKPWEAGGRVGGPPEAQVPQRGVRGEKRE